MTARAANEEATCFPSSARTHTHINSRLGNTDTTDAFWRSAFDVGEQFSQLAKSGR